MKPTKLKLFLGPSMSLLVAALGSQYGSGPANAQDAVPKLVNYQGRLTDAGGQPLSNGTYRVRFELFTDKTAPTNLVWGAEYNVAAVSGQFNVVLGAAGGTPVPGAAVNDISFAFGSAERYLQMTILTNGTSWIQPQVLAPRQQILSAPYAISALHGVPPGTILPYGGITPPPGFLMCNGQSYLKANYANLSAMLNNAYGGNTTNFNVPDFRGTFLRGADDPDGSGTTFGTAGVDPDRSLRGPMNAGGATGNNVGSVQLSAFTNHDHQVNISGYTSTNTHTHVISGAYASGIGGSNSSDFDAALRNNDGTAYSENTGSTATYHTFTVSGNTISSGGSETRPVNAYVNFIIKF